MSVPTLPSPPAIDARGAAASAHGRVRAAPSPAHTKAEPLELPRLVMRRALAVALVFLLLGLVLGVVAARRDTQEEIAGALVLARMGERLGELPIDDGQALASLRRLGELRHLELRITQADGQVLHRSESPPLAAPLRWLMGPSHRDDGRAQAVSWPVVRPDGRTWVVTLTASPDSEQREALTNLLGMFGLLAGCSVLMLGVMHWNVSRALRPLRTMLAAIAGIERRELGAVRTLAPMPIRELEATAGALRDLAASLEQAEAGRRMLAHKILTLQEDERQRLARDLHDEFGQRLTALRVDAAWLGRRLDGDAAAAPVVAGMVEQIARIQQDVRELLARLQPLARADESERAGESESAARLAELLDALAASWNRSGAGGLRVVASVGASPAMASLDALALPRDLVLALYRISQEALTNAARHADARAARIVVDIDLGRPGVATLRWSACDDGRGLAEPATAFQRGNGLAGMKERVWALGGEFDWSPANPPPMRGLHLRAALSCAFPTDKSPEST